MINSNSIKEQYFAFIRNRNIEIFCPFITYSILEKIIDHSNSISRIETRWRLSDFADGFADLKIYELCKENNIHFYINPRVHLKATINESGFVFLSSANITEKGLNYNQGDRYNYELSSIEKVTKNKEMIYFESIVQDSIFVNDDIFEDIKEKVELLENGIVKDVDEFGFNYGKDYYISQLPQTYNPEILYSYYDDQLDMKFENLDYQRAIHDLSIYQVEQNLTREDFYTALRSAFLKHPFIVGLLAEVEKNGFIYFGRVKEWIHNNCLDVPVPKRRELTETVQVLYKWIEVLGGQTYIIDRPHHSQRIRVL